MYIVYVMLISMHAHVLRFLLAVTSKHDGSDSTALPNENGQLGVGLLQINIVASNKINSLKRRHINDHQHHYPKNYVPHRT